MRVSTISNAYAPKLNIQKTNFKQQISATELNTLFNSKLKELGNPYSDEVYYWELKHDTESNVAKAFGDRIVLYAHFKCKPEEPVVCENERFSLLYNKREDAVRIIDILLAEVNDESMEYYRELAHHKPVKERFSHPLP